MEEHKKTQISDDNGAGADLNKDLPSGHLETVQRGPVKKKGLFSGLFRRKEKPAAAALPLAGGGAGSLGTGAVAAAGGAAAASSGGGVLMIVGALALGGVGLGVNHMMNQEGAARKARLEAKAKTYKPGEKAPDLSGYAEQIPAGQRSAAPRSGLHEVSEANAGFESKRAAEAANAGGEGEESATSGDSEGEAATAQAAAPANPMDPSALLAQLPAGAAAGAPGAQKGLGGLGNINSQFSGSSGGSSGARAPALGRTGGGGAQGGADGFGAGRMLDGSGGVKGNQVKGMRRNRKAAGQSVAGGGGAPAEGGSLRRLGEIQEQYSAGGGGTNVDTLYETGSAAWDQGQSEGAAAGGSGVGGGGIEAGGVASSPSLDNAAVGGGGSGTENLNDMDDDHEGESSFGTLGRIAQLLLAVASILMIYIGFFADLGKSPITFAAQAVAAALTVTTIVLGGLVTLMGLWMAFKEGQKGAGLMLATTGALVTTGASLALAAGEGGAAAGWAAVAGIVGAIGTLGSMFFG